jgi:hypothetical protein
MHGRERERETLKRKLETGLSIHMPAPRRIGKTWTMGRVATDLRAAGWLVVEVDVEGMGTPEKFARDLCMRIEGVTSIKQRFKAHATQRLNNLLGGSWGDKPIDALGRVDPIEFAETLIAALNDSGDKIAIIIDEISYFFLALAEADPKQANAFAYRLRGIQQRYRNVRWLITGSIGLHTIARRYGLEGAFVDFETFVLEPFTRAEARSFMRDPSIQQQFNHIFDATDADFDAAFERLGWLAPYYLKLVANEVRPTGVSDGEAPTIATRADFDAAFDKLLQPNRKSEFAVWREHISKNLPAADRAVAYQTLNALCRSPAGETEDTLVAHLSQKHGAVERRQLRELLEMLVTDGLIVKSGPRYAFRSGLVRSYWQEYEAE